MKPKKIFLIIGGTSGSLIHFRGELIQELLDKQYNVHVAAPFYEDSNSIYLKLAEKGVIIHHIPLKRTGLNPFQDMRSAYSLIKSLRKIRPNYVLSYTIKPVIYGSLAAKIVGTKHIFCLISGLGYAFERGNDTRNIVNRLLFSLIKGLYKSALKSSELVFFQNPDDERLFRHLNILKKNIKSYIVNGSGVDTVHYKHSPSVTRTSYNFLFIGRILISKGIRDFVEAAKQILRKYDNVSFTVLGRLDTNPSSVSEMELNSWVRDGLVTYLGQVLDVRTAIMACSAFVLPSYREGTPRSALEAMSIGRPIITTDAPGCRETVIHGHNGFLVPVNSPEHIAASMSQLIDNPELISMMGENSRQLAITKYDVHLVNKSMIKAMGIEI